tara:strand:- start:123 stop:608 length:486 start_codon:yes stop_codon:yes gene_type:complete
MKPLLLFIGLAVVGAAFFWLWPETETAVAPSTTEEVPTQPTPTEAPTETPLVNDSAVAPEKTIEGEPEVAEPKVFNISGKNFAFDVTQMRVKEGDTVTVNFESADGFHDWVVDEFSAATNQVPVGTPTSVTFVADKAGTYEYYCSVGSHRAQGMTGTLIVE